VSLYNLSASKDGLTMTVLKPDGPKGPGFITFSTQPTQRGGANMNYSRRVVTRFVALCCLSAILLASGLGVTRRTGVNPQTMSPVRPPKELEILALQLVSQQHNIPLANLEVENSWVVTYPHSGRKVNEFSVGDKRNDNAYFILLDDNKNLLDKTSLLQEEEAARAAKYGKLSEDLFEYLQHATAEEDVGVTIWLDLGPESDRPKDEPSFDSEAFKKMTEQERQQLSRKLQDFDNRLKAYNATRAHRVVDPVAQRLKQMGYQPRILEGTGYIGLKAKPAIIRQIEGWAEVRQISRDRVAEPAAPRRSAAGTATALDVSRPMIGANLVENRGINGQNASIAQIEVGGRIIPGIGSGNPYLNNITQDDTDVCVGQPQEHSCAVAGIIHSSATLPPVFIASMSASCW
jgi:hypothetical protein